MCGAFGAFAHQPYAACLHGPVSSNLVGDATIPGATLPPHCRRSTLVNYTLDCEQEEDGRWIAEVLELPGVLTYGTSRDEAILKAEALALRVIAERLEQRVDGQATIGVSSSSATLRLVGLCLRFPPWRGSWAAHAGASRKAHGTLARRPVGTATRRRLLQGLPVSRARRS